MRRGALLTTLARRGSAPAPPSVPALSNPSLGAMNTTVTNDLADDGFSWANAHPLVVDQFGNVITLAQKDGGGNKQHSFVWLNASGTTWTDNALAESFFERGTFVYDAAQNAIHCLWITTNPDDGGVIYRRYDVARTGQNITGITRTSGVNLVLDGLPSAPRYTHPVMLFLNDAAYGVHGALVACWSAHETNKNEVRSSMCVLGSSATRGGTAANWAAPVSASTSTLSQAPQVLFTALVANTNPGVVYASLTRKPNGDLYLLYFDGTNVPLTGAWRWRRARWNSGSNDWSTGLTADTFITNVQRAGTDTGYNLKGQLGTAWSYDSVNDRMIAGLATWKDNTAGDTWGYVGVNADDSLTALVDVYSVGGAHNFAPTGDVTYDATAHRLVVSWLNNDDNGAYVQLFDGLSSAGDALLAFADAPIDIPLLYPRLNDQLLMLFRDRTVHSGQRFHGWYGTVDWTTADAAQNVAPMMGLLSESGDPWLYDRSSDLVELH